MMLSLCGTMDLVRYHLYIDQKSRLFRRSCFFERNSRMVNSQIIPSNISISLDLHLLSSQRTAVHVWIPEVTVLSLIVNSYILYYLCPKPETNHLQCLSLWLVEGRCEGRFDRKLSALPLEGVFTHFRKCYEHHIPNLPDY